MAVTYADFVATFPELAGLPQATIEFNLETAAMIVHQHVWKTKTDIGIKLLAAHRTAQTQISQNGIISGPVTSISASQGSQSLSFGSPSSDKTDAESLTGTIYGRQYLTLYNALPMSGFVA